MMAEEWRKWYFCKWNSDPYCEKAAHRMCHYGECEDYQKPDFHSSVQTANTEVGR